jgi:hypothetical protein
VPDARISSHEPSARKNLKPSFVSSATVRATAGRRGPPAAVREVDEEPPLRLVVDRRVDVDVDRR